jgi:uncharacterized protein (DUF952 family)
VDAEQPPGPAPAAPAEHLAAGEHIFHLARETDWAAARAAGEYLVSTLGRTLAQEGFVHASRRHQVAGVHAAFYRGLDEPLLLLEVDPARLRAEVRLEVPPGAAEAFPHVYGPLDVGAVVAVRPYP